MARQLAERLQLDLKLKVRSYSTGNRRKLGLVVTGWASCAAGS